MTSLSQLFLGNVKKKEKVTKNSKEITKGKFM